MTTEVVFIRASDNLQLAMIEATQPVLANQKIHIENILYVVLETQWTISKIFARQSGFVKCFVREFVE